MITYVDNTLLDTLIMVPQYRDIAKIVNTGPDPPHTLYLPTHIYCCMDGVRMAVQVRTEHQTQVFDVMVLYLKCIFPYLLYE